MAGWSLGIRAGGCGTGQLGPRPGASAFSCLKGHIGLPTPIRVILSRAGRLRPGGRRKSCSHASTPCCFRAKRGGGGWT